MLRTLNIAASGMAAQETNLEAVSNNIANANTVGYKRQRMEFQDLLYQQVRTPGTATSASTQSPGGLQVGSGVRIVGSTRMFEQGTLQTTGNQLDVAIEGRGFLAVQQPDGTLAYTRSGNLQTDGEGRIVTPEGAPLDPALTIPPDATGISISSDGKVMASIPGEQAPVEIGQITLATFVNPSGLQALGHNLFTATAASGEAQVGAPGSDGRGTLMQGAIEGANVNVVEEMIGLITSQRSYEINSKVITAADEMLRAATQLK
ncbi:MAG: flagellar basal-body rod protein FlgG [Polyangiaceae bacterium]|nr:flagellar basal-body rod protein FlgG [Polyangiaceae bacterium]